MTSRRSSGSSCVDSAVEPTRSQNITVMWRRSATLAARRGGSAGAGAAAPGAASSLVPHCVQKRDPAGLAWPQAAQTEACGVPHCGQNLLSPGVLLAQLGQLLVVAIAWGQLLPHHIVRPL